ncbi:MAG: hypothetical protein Q7N87_00045 [Candidatus Uhrbacteria bacterium]|nr:hypothetical protein [Candidatus Uhrbacteria bacterium]
MRKTFLGLWFFMHVGCASDQAASEVRPDKPDLLQESSSIDASMIDLGDMKIEQPDLNGPMALTCTIETRDVGEGHAPVLLASNRAYMLAMNGQNGGFASIDKRGKTISFKSFPKVIDPCPVAPRTCIGPFSVHHGAAASDGFLFSMVTGAVADIVIKVSDLGMVYLAKPGNGYTFTFGGAVFTDDGTYAISPTGPMMPALWNVWTRARDVFSRIEGITYDRWEQGRIGVFDALNAAHAENIVAFGSAIRENQANQPLIALADVAGKTSIEVQLTYQGCVPIMGNRVPDSRVRRVFNQNGMFYVLWQEGPSNNVHSCHEMTKMGRDGAIKNTETIADPFVRDLAQIKNGFMGVLYEYVQQRTHRIGFTLFDADMKPVHDLLEDDLMARGFSEAAIVNSDMPTISCIDPRHCAAAWDGATRVYLATYACD